jgi:hypothetical protein
MTLIDVCAPGVTSMNVGDIVEILISYNGNTGKIGVVTDTLRIKVTLESGEEIHFTYEDSLKVIGHVLPGHGLNNRHLSQELPP